jgi:hypothetical protein
MSKNFKLNIPNTNSDVDLPTQCRQCQRNFDVSVAQVQVLLIAIIEQIIYAGAQLASSQFRHWDIAKSQCQHWANSSPLWHHHGTIIWG